MAEPRGVPPFPEHGDEDPDDTYKTVGRSLSEWEGLEYQLSHLYAQFIGQPARISVMRQYGAGRIFADRMAALKRVAEAFFIRLPNQDTEAEFDRIANAALRLADRRNEIAHGIVRPLQWTQSMSLAYEQLRVEFALVPPLYSRQKLDGQHRPKYIYTANELMQFGLAFGDLSREALHLKLRIARIQRT